ncbi:hypothetical protein QM467_15530 [Rhodoblastus sp. 17X3]|uniref:hypothetical protein n=1 Tax=Rhodoblastus sp. 17X3 TaxID=3047026 RepID=UPI0024B81BAE|nr:hypothetical protein [Rhodoblastus sp. 17X3]MDI9849467.1 hypothetical protein [Rhodoblastus sp. 17X3]
MSFSFRAALVLFAGTFAVAPAWAEDVTIAEAVLAKGPTSKIIFRNIAIKDSNLSQAEATSLFTGALSREDLGAMLERMQASRVTIPEAEIQAENGDHFTLHDIAADSIAHGGAQSLSFASADGVLPDDSGDTAVRLGALRVDHVSMPGLAAALRAGDPGVAAFRFSHLVLESGDLSAVDKGTPAGAPGGNRVLLHTGPATIDQSFDSDGAPLEGAASLTGISLKMPPKSKGGESLTAFGFPELSGEFQFAGAYDPAAKIYRLKTYGLDVKNAGRIALSAQFSGVPKVFFTGEKDVRQKAVRDAFVDWAQIDISNAGLFDKVVAFVSISQRKPPEAVKAEWRAIVSQAPLLFSGAAVIAVAAHAIDKFISDPKTLTLRIKGKDSPLKLDDFAHIEDLSAFLNRLDVTSSPGPSGPAKPASGTRL